MVNTKRELWSPKKSTRTKTANISKHRPSLKEVLKSSSRPIKYHPCIDDSEDDGDKSEVALDIDIRDHQIRAERLFRD